MPRFPRLGVFFALAIATVLACGDSADHQTDDNNFRPDVIECEDALARLAKCCPSFDATPVLCDYHYHYTSGCGSSTTDTEAPALSRDESTCIRATSCDALQGSGVCARAQRARAYTYTRVDQQDAMPDIDSSTHAPVCP